MGKTNADKIDATDNTYMHTKTNRNRQRHKHTNVNTEI